LLSPSLDPRSISEAVQAVRASLNLGPSDVVARSQILQLFKEFGALLVPVFWGGEKDGHENAMSVYLPESHASWVVFNLGCKEDDFNYWLAHEYGHCLTLHQLTGDEGEAFAEAFAQQLLFPTAAAEEAVTRIQAHADPLAAANYYAGKYEVSVITVVRAIDRVLLSRGEKESGIVTNRFWGTWRKSRSSVPSIAKQLLGTETPSAMEYVVKTEEYFDTNVFKALQGWQAENGGRDPAFISAALNIRLPDAIELSHALWERNLSGVPT
jgi:Zn-dependent peptidase ImmA (M78 family)